MIDARILPLQKAALQPVAMFLAQRGVRADQISLIGFLVGLGAFAALSLEYWLTALFFVLANRALDGLDGAVARIQGPTDRGAYLDIALDMVFYALIPLGFAIAAPEVNALPAAVLIVSFVGTGSSFLAFSAIAAKLGRQAPEFPTKGIYYAGGLAEGFETIVVFAVMCLLPASFPDIAYGFAALCGLTTLLRWRQAWVVFSGGAR
ncbi:MAG: CDP-alcohol phosphatidyltransferase family protein [Rhizobium sp.]|nr:CDP-alcohol phosphatidyltransferase family protein [Rhizobium sp.]